MDGRNRQYCSAALYSRVVDESNRCSAVQVQYKRDCYLSAIYLAPIQAVPEGGVQTAPGNDHIEAHNGTEWWVSWCPASKTKALPAIQHSVFGQRLRPPVSQWVCWQSTAARYRNVIWRCRVLGQQRRIVAKSRLQFNSCDFKTQLITAWLHQSTFWWFGVDRINKLSSCCSVFYFLCLAYSLDISSYTLGFKRIGPFIISYIYSDIDELHEKPTNTHYMHMRYI